ncbi:hypothetical protein Tco_0689702 [Tanacetum coccineum]
MEDNSRNEEIPRGGNLPKLVSGDKEKCPNLYMYILAMPVGMLMEPWQALEGILCDSSGQKDSFTLRREEEELVAPVCKKVRFES